VSATCQAIMCKGRPAVVAVTHRIYGTRLGCLPCAHATMKARAHRRKLLKWKWLTTKIGGAA
jgi:hypothetical protein